MKSIVIGSFHPKIGLFLRSPSSPNKNFYFTLKDLLILKPMLVNRFTIIFSLRCVLVNRSTTILSLSCVMKSNFQFNWYCVDVNL